MNKIFNFTETDEEAVIEVYGEIGESWWSEGVTLQSVSEQIKEIADKKKRCVVKINSLGGDINDGLAIYDLLRSMGDKVTTECYGMCASAATVIAMAGSVRRMSRYGFFLIHKCWSCTAGNENVLEAELETQRIVNDRIAQLYADVTGTDKAKIEELINENNGDGRWITSDEAMEYGFITEEIASERANLSAAFVMRSLKNLFNIKSQETMKQEEFDALKAQLEQEKATLENSLEESNNAKAALESENKDLKEKVQNLETEHQQKVDALNARINELQAIIDKAPATVVNTNGNDPKEKSFEDWYGEQDYVKEAKKELGM